MYSRDILSFLSERKGRIRKILLKNKGWRHTLRWMRRLVDKGKTDILIRIFALRNAVPPRRLHSLYLALRRKVRYVADPRGIETLQSPRYTLTYGAGDCDDLTILFNAVAEAAGYRTGFVVAGRGGSLTHVYSAVLTRRGWIPVDLAQGHFGRRPPRYDYHRLVDIIG